MLEKHATLTVEDREYQLPFVEGSEGDKAVDIRTLLKDTGYITLDSGYMNTGSCKSAITFVDGQKGILNYRGYAIQDLAEHCSFVEVVYLLLIGELPTQEQLNNFRELLAQHALIHEDMIHFFDHFPPNASPMSILSTMVNTLCNFYPELTADSDDALLSVAARLISKVRTIAAFSYKKSVGHPLVYPRYDLSYCGNFLNMMFDKPVKDNLFNLLGHEQGIPYGGGCAGYGCGAGFNFVSLLPDGEVHACRKLPSLIGNMYQQHLGEIYHGLLAGQYRQGSAACQGCEIRPVCGGCLAVAYGYGRDIFRDVDPYCWKEDRDKKCILKSEQGVEGNAS